MINIPKGTKDILPKESYKWQFIEQTARDVAKVFNVNEIRTPTFEHTEVFLRGVGETTDIVNKEMYTFLDKGGRSITLKPEGTAGVVRSFVENGMASQALPSKMFYLTQCFRYERPQAGRLREFHQFGVEFLGSHQPDADAETILLAKTLLDKLGIKNVTLYLNSIGCKNCRAKYEMALKEYLNQNYNDLCDLCKDRLVKNPLRVLDCKNPQCSSINQNAPVILDYVCDDCREHFEKVKNLLTSVGVEYKINPKIVRGLDYYTKTVFEFVSENIGAQGTVCGGGRYDGLVSQLGGPEIPGIGFALGIERLLLLMENTGVEIPDKTQIKVYIAPMGEKCQNKAFEIADKLRKEQIPCEIDHMARGIKAQFKYADKLKVKFVAVIGEDELSRGVLKVKDMATGKDLEVAEKDFVEFIKKS